SLEGWEKQALHQVIIDVAEQFELKLGKLAQPIRVAMTSSTVSPPIDITLQLIGRERVLARLERAVGFIEALA
ncbi:MAG: glutamate--tRNA ligase, partial [Gammaproteobacteria bacterium]|nr:glutamate--tRNA ligase [Gammaproteobacteria bacterium]